MVNVTLFFSICRGVRPRSVQPTHLITLLIYDSDQAQKLEVALALIYMRR